MSLEPLDPFPATPTPPLPAADPPPPTLLSCFRWAAFPVATLNLLAAAMGSALLILVFGQCGARQKVPVTMASAAATAKIAATAAAAIAQRAVAKSIISRSEWETGSEEAGERVRLQRKMKYKRWLWWTRLGMGVTILQFIAALYLMVIIVKDFSLNSTTKECYLGEGTERRKWRRMSVIFFVILAWLVAIIQCFTGSDVLRWRSFYATHDAAWKAHYLEVFDHGIREIMCCLGRVKYLAVSEEDEVYSVARLLGDLVAYRASGTGHLDFLAGLALLQRYKQSQTLNDDLVEAPTERIREAAACHHFAEAAYTGPLLDFGRNPILFPCVWIHRQSVLTPWTRGRRPLLEGDNWWRGHAAAFLKYVNLHPNSLLQGRIRQTQREAAYFVVSLHDLKSIVIAVRGTETPEDLLTDGLCKECMLTDGDLDGLINGSLTPEVKAKVLSSTHYGHSGIVESARELFMQLDGQRETTDMHHSKNTGLLSSLLRDGEECHGYRICIVGHSLGGSVAAMLGIRLRGRYPNLHVYAYGPLPCVDPVVAEACSEFVTSIVYNDEFSSRLSVNSILRLRAAAVAALSDDSAANTATVSRLVRRVFHANRHQSSNISDHHHSLKVEANNHFHRRSIKYAVKGGTFLCAHTISCMVNMSHSQPSSPSKRCDCAVLTNAVSSSREVSESYNPRMARGSCGPIQQSNSQDEILLFERMGFETVQDKVEQVSTNETMTADVIQEDNNEGGSLEVFLPGLVVHIVPEQKSIFPQRNGWRLQNKKAIYKAFVAKREYFKDIVVTPYMFLDHLPWRCHHGLHAVLEAQNQKGCHLSEDQLNEAHAV